MWPGTMEVVTACDWGGPIQAGDIVSCMGPYVTKGSSCGCGKIALHDLTFKDMPIEPLAVLRINWEGADVVDEP